MVTFDEKFAKTKGINITFSISSTIIRQLTVSPGSKFLLYSLMTISTGKTLIFDLLSLFCAKLATVATYPVKVLSEKASGRTCTFSPFVMCEISVSLILTLAFNLERSGSCIICCDDQHWSPI